MKEKRARIPKFIANNQKVGANLVFARFSSLKNGGHIFGRTQGSPLPMRLFRKINNLTVDLGINQKPEEVTDVG